VVQNKQVVIKYPSKRDSFSVDFVCKLNSTENSFHFLSQITFSNIFLAKVLKLAIRLFQRYERLGKRLWGRHLWSRGYCVSTIGINEEHLRQYVRWQEKKEKEIEKLQGNLFDEDRG
jgi:putative transposase